MCDVDKLLLMDGPTEYMCIGIQYRSPNISLGTWPKNNTMAKNYCSKWTSYSYKWFPPRINTQFGLLWWRTYSVISSRRTLDSRSAARMIGWQDKTLMSWSWKWNLGVWGSTSPRPHQHCGTGAAPCTACPWPAAPHTRPRSSWRWPSSGLSQQALGCLGNRTATSRQAQSTVKSS